MMFFKKYLLIKTDENLALRRARQELNLGLKNSGLCDFHHSLDCPFTVYKSVCT